MGISTPTPVQVNCIPPALQGKNIVGSAQTGSGKTAAFALPILQQLYEDPFGIYALVLTPTRELAQQILEQFSAFGARHNTRVCLVVGGLDMTAQSLELSRRPHVVVATPGRLRDHMQCGTAAADMRRLKWLVLDEADRLLDESMAPCVEKIVRMLPDASRRQTLLFSATINSAVERAQKMFCEKEEPFRYTAVAEGTINSRLLQQYLFIPHKVKDAYLNWILQTHEATSLIIFCSKCTTCQLVCCMLQKLEHNAVALNSHLSQKNRFASLGRFRAGAVKILVATDVAARGLDIPTVELVINYDLPASAETYLHRVGRTARAGKGGQAVSLVSQYDIDLVHNIEEYIDSKMTEFEADEDEALLALNKVSEAVSYTHLTLPTKRIV
eukprot:TRINITY_DN20001_c0_g1_i4.p1 TRINITY_DN20001_c0_g1~~TRINITY_DN20001_c0_g1_i4.p1  ORF type:complete len:385 (-),score=72.16 TRINITY_DN20001_c0_g1_i4:98-1252(-)